MAITCLDELRHSPAARDTKSSSTIIIIIFGIFQFLFYVFRYADCDITWKRNYPKARLLPFGYKK
jgi:hypothetical protein